MKKHPRFKNNLSKFQIISKKIIRIFGRAGVQTFAARIFLTFRNIAWGYLC